MRYLSGFLVFLSAVLFSWTAVAQEIEVPEDIQVKLFAKILTFDRKIKERAGEEMVLGLVYQQKFRKSLNVKNRFEKYLRLHLDQNDTIEGIPVRAVSLDLEDFSQFHDRLSEEKVDIIYVAPLRAIDIEALAAVSRDLGITSMTGVPEYCGSGIAVCIGSKGGTPQIIINLQASQSEGADFGSRLLKLARIINK